MNQELVGGLASQDSAEQQSYSIKEEPTKPPGVMSFLFLVWLKRRLWLLPVLTSAWLFLSFWTSYGIAVSNNHTEAAFPYISHTAIEAPERCVFGQMVNIGAVMLAMNILLRYLYIKKFLQCKKVHGTSGWYKANILGLVLGILSAFGLSMVANFQTEVQRIPHYVGAGLCFGVGIIYCWLESVLSWKIHFKLKDKPIIMWFQIINSIVLTLLAGLFIITKALFKAQESAGHGTKWDGLRVVFLTSSVTEWLLAVSVLTFTLTYAPEFKNMTVEDPKIELNPEFEKRIMVNVVRHVTFLVFPLAFDVSYCNGFSNTVEMKDQEKGGSDKT